MTSIDDSATSLASLSNKKNDQDGKDQNIMLNQEEEDKKKIDLAIKFWKHPQLRHTMTVDQQRHYLQQKGVTDTQLYQAWDHMLLLDHHHQQQQQQQATSSNHGRTSAAMNHPVGPSPAHQTPHSSENQSYPHSSSSYNNNHPHYPSPPQQYLHSMTPNDDALLDPLTVVQGTSLMALGGLIGLSAAAAVRWLNGGDFHLLASTSTKSSSQHDNELPVDRSATLSTSKDDQTEEVVASEDDLAEYPYEVEEYDDDDDDGVADQLLQSMESLSQQVHSQGTIQQQILQKLGPSKHNQAITDSSMDWLRKSSSSVTNKEDKNKGNQEQMNKKQELLQEIGDELMEIKTQLLTEGTSEKEKEDASGMKESGDGNATAMTCSSTTIQAVVTRIEACMAKVNQVATLSTPTVADTSTSTSLVSPAEEGACITSIAIPSHTATSSSSPVPLPLEEKNGNNIQDALVGSNVPQNDDQDEKDRGNEATSVTTTSPTTYSTTDITDEATDVHPNVTVAPIKLTLRQAIRKIATENDATSIRIGTHLLYLFVVNLSGKPNSARHRKIFTSTDSFKKVEHLQGGIDLLMSVGFDREEDKDESPIKHNNLEWLPNGTPDDEVLCLERLKEAASALALLKSGKPSSELTERALAFLAPDPDVEFSKR